MVRTLFGVETEYAITAFDDVGKTIGRELIARKLLRHAMNQSRFAPDRGGGIFLPNGARFYIDCGTHPEYATPECSNPWDVVRQVRAGERLLLRWINSAAEEPDVQEIIGLRSNVDYQGTTWGCHESYLHRGDPTVLPEQLIPHFATRIVYCGAGGFVPTGRQSGFTLSPRSWFLRDALTTNTTSERGLFNLRREPLSRGFHRMHVICGESVCSDTALLLKVGTTALILACIDVGYRPGDPVQLATPVEALRRFAADPTCRHGERLRNGNEVTALDIQRHYLEQVERCRVAGHLPDWAESLCLLWRTHLERLEESPASVARTLDWAIKLALFKHRSGGTLPWREFGDASEVCRHAAAAMGLPVNIGASLTKLVSGGTTGHRLASVRALMAATGQSWRTLSAFLKLHDRLLETDIRFGQLGAKGVFQQLDDAQLLRHRVVTQDEIERACTTPPPNTRAHVRGAYIAQLDRPGRVFCNWTGVSDPDRGYLDLTNPFTTEARWLRSSDETIGARVRQAATPEQEVDPAQGELFRSEFLRALRRQPTGR